MMGVYRAVNKCGDKHWTKTEFSGIDFGDKRLSERFIKTLAQLSDQPMASINQACEDWAATKAAYRMFDNEKVTPEEIMRVHQKKTIERVKKYDRVLSIQDTCFLNYTKHRSVEGLGSIGHLTQKAKGLVMHTALAISTDGVSLGILDQKIWARKKDRLSHQRKLRHKRINIEEKESNKWLTAIFNTAALPVVNTEIITCGDREMGFYQFIGRAEHLKSSYLVRAAWDRAIQIDHEASYLWEHLAKQPLAGTHKIKVETKRIGKRKIQASRIAKLEIRFGSVEIRRPKKLKLDRTECPPYLPADVIWVTEVNCPKGIEPVEWMLLTNVAVKCFKDALERVNWYKLRWHIESFHKVLKSGCTVEECRLEKAERLERYITAFSVIAWRLYWMTHLSRTQPEAPCTKILADHEWKALYCKIKKTKTLPIKTPTLRETVHWIAQLGGFLARKGDGEPGMTTIWRGWQRMNDITEDWLIFHGT